MKYRVHYQHKGQSLSVDLAAESGTEARMKFKHHYPNCALSKIEPLEAPSKPAAPKTPPLIVRRPATEEQTQEVAAGLRAFREQFAVTMEAGQLAACPQCKGPARRSLGRFSRRWLIVPIGCGHSVLEEATQ